MGYVFLIAMWFVSLFAAVSTAATFCNDKYNKKLIIIMGSVLVFLSSLFALGYGYDYNYARGWNDHITLGGGPLNQNNRLDIDKNKEHADIIREYNKLTHSIAVKRETTSEEQ